jgi:succinoglycan biosynthesis transport protein ExoP
MGLVAAGLAAIALWIGFPETSSATALFRVDSERKSLVFDVERSTQRFETFCRTQVQLLKSYFVLQAAIRNPDVASLSIFAGKNDPVQWLQDNLIADFPQQSEILSIGLSGAYPIEDQTRVVDAVATAYQNEVVDADKFRRLKMRDALAKTLNRVKEELEEKMGVFYNIARDLGQSQGATRDPETEMLIGELNGIQKRKAALEQQMTGMQTEFQVFKQQMDDPSMIDAQVQQILAADMQYANLQQEMMMTAYRMTQAKKQQRRRTRSIAKLEREYAGLQQQAAQYRNNIKRQVENAKITSPNNELQRLTKEFQLRFGALRRQYAALDATAEEKLEELKEKMGKSVDLEMRSSELEQLQDVAKDMSIKLESIDVEAQLPEEMQQIQQIQRAVGSVGINKVQHYAIAILGGLGAFALTCFGIAFVEFHKRRLNEPNQVDEGLGIRVVGTLPMVNGRRANDPNALIAHVTASIDSVRTLLMHDSSSKRRQAVLVTSADANEGRTTVASQLAASLARAGRRTLLVDGDVRRPKLHELFDVGLEDGLCEVLRAEVDVADVIRPTHSEGLWLLTAGYCDRDAIQALATEQMQPIFDKLRGEYDFIIIDGAPALGISDALIFGQYSDGAILAVRRDHSQMPKIHQAAELLRGVGIRVIGAVVNGVSSKSDDRITQLQLITSKAEQQMSAAT